MSKFIGEFYDFLSFLEGKNIATKRPPERIDSALYFTIIDVYNHYRDHYVKTKKISQYLIPFKRTAAITLTTGVSALPADCEITREFYDASGKLIPIVEDAFWNHHRNRKVGAPSATNPIARIENSTDPTPIRQIQVYPTSVASGTLLYFKAPAKPKWAYDVVGTRYVYNEGASTDIDFSILLYPDLINRVLASIGVNLRENQVVQFTQAFKAEEQIK